MPLGNLIKSLNKKGRKDAVDNQSKVVNGGSIVRIRYSIVTRTDAALKIQSAYRAYLARKELRSLKGLVKFQALVRGSIVRKQSMETFRRMQVLIQIQTLTCARRPIQTNIVNSKSSSQSKYDSASTEKKLSSRAIAPNLSSTQAMVDRSLDKPEAVMWKVWLAKAKHRYMGVISDMKRYRKKPIFMDKNLYDQVGANCNLPEVKRKTERNLENRHTNISPHRGDSKSFQEHRAIVRKELGGDPSTSEHMRTHAVQIEAEDGNVSYRWNDERAKNFIAEFKDENDEFLATQLCQTFEEERRHTLTPEEEIFDFNMITKLKKHRGYGYENQEVLSSKSSFSSKVLDVVELQAKLEEIEMARLAEKAQLKAKKARLAEERAAKRAELEARFEAKRAELDARYEAEQAHMYF